MKASPFLRDEKTGKSAEKVRKGGKENHRNVACYGGFVGDVVAWVEMCRVGIVQQQQLRRHP